MLQTLITLTLVKRTLGILTLTLVIREDYPSCPSPRPSLSRSRPLRRRPCSTSTRRPCWSTSTSARSTTTSWPALATTGSWCPSWPGRPPTGVWVRLGYRRDLAAVRVSLPIVRAYLHPQGETAEDEAEQAVEVEHVVSQRAENEHREGHTPDLLAQRLGPPPPTSRSSTSTATTHARAAPPPCGRTGPAQGGARGVGPRPVLSPGGPRRGRRGPR